LGCLTIIAAAAFTVSFFGVLTPPRDPVALLTPPATPSTQAPTIVRPAATVLPPIPPLYLADSFSTRNNWPLAVGDGPYSYTNNGYLLAPPGNTEFTHVFLDKFNDTVSIDLSVQVEAKPFPGSSGVGYGVFFWHDTSKDGQERFIYFGVTTEGMYTLRTSVPISRTTETPSGRRWVDLVPETPSPSIETNGLPNRLRVDAHPHRILAFVNGDLVLDRDNPDVDTFRERDDYDGKVGLLAYSLGKPSARVLFTVFELYSNVNK
jgi:hypothetical protein